MSFGATLGDAAPPQDERDRQQLVAALQAAHQRDHDLVLDLQNAHALIAEGRRALETQTQLLQTRTIERDHFKQDGHLWALCLAHLVRQDSLELLSLDADAVNACEGLMLSAKVENGYVNITVNERPAASEEGGGPA